jgi:hypothetical protein
MRIRIPNTGLNTPEELSFSRIKPPQFLQKKTFRSHNKFLNFFFSCGPFFLAFLIGGCLFEVVAAALTTDTFKTLNQHLLL